MSHQILNLEVEMRTTTTEMIHYLNSRAVQRRRQEIIDMLFQRHPGAIVLATGGIAVVLGWVGNIIIH